MKYGTIIENVYTCGHTTPITDGQREYFTILQRQIDGRCYLCDQDNQPYVEDTTALQAGYAAVAAQRQPTHEEMQLAEQADQTDYARSIR